MQTETNPYAAPRAPLSEQATRSFISVVLLGAAIGNGFYYAAISVLGMGYFWLLVLQGVPTGQLFVHVYASSAYLVFAHSVGFICMVTGGYWSARLDEEKGSSAALWAAAVLSALAILDHLAPYDLPIPAWSRVVSVLAPFPAFWLGARLRGRQRVQRG